MYAWLEEQPEADDQKAYQAFLNEILATTNISDSQFEALLSYTGRAHLDPAAGAAARKTTNKSMIALSSLRWMA